MYHVHASDFIRYSLKSHLRFLKLRLARVYPLHAFCLLALAVIVYSLPEFTAPYRHNAFSLSNFVATLLLINNWGLIPTTMWNGPAWSLSAEWLGYLMFPLIAIGIDKVVPRNLSLITAFSLLAALVIFMFALGAPDMGQMNKIGIIRMAFEFTAGCLFYRASMNDSRPRNWTLALSLLVIIVFSYRLDYHWGAVFGLGLLVFCLCKESLFANLFFGNPIALWLGNISFSLYLCHWPLIQIYQWISPRVTVDKNILATVLVLAIIICSVLLYRFVELPSRRFLRQRLLVGRAPTVDKLLSTHA